MRRIVIAAKLFPDGYKAVEFCYLLPNVEVVRLQLGEPVPPCDLLISYLWPKLFTAEDLAQAKRAINFHSGPPEYPGIGCTNWALYEGATEYGATCHEMTEQWDAGKILAVSTFRVFPGDTVESLTDRTYAALLVLFYKVVPIIDSMTGSPFYLWTGQRRTRQDLERLATLTKAMSDQEIRRRIRATVYKEWKTRWV